MVIAYINQKGGVGKTTLALHTAWELAHRGDKVLLVDADPQNSASDWASLRDTTPFGVVGCARSNLHVEVKKLRPYCDWLVIDGPPRNNDIARSCLVASDLVVVPAEPSIFSNYAAVDTFKQLNDARAFRPNLAVCQVINRKIPRTVIGREWRDVASQASDSADEPAPPPVLDAEITLRVEFAKAATAGRVVQESAPASPAAREIQALVDELAAFCKNLHQPQAAGVSAP